MSRVIAALAAMASAMASAMLPDAAMPEEVRRARGHVHAGSYGRSGGRVSNRRKKIREELADRNVRLAWIRGTPKLRNAAKRVRQGRLSTQRFLDLVAEDWS